MSTDHNSGSERRAEADSNRGPSAYQPTALPVSQTGSQHAAMRDILMQSLLYCLFPLLVSDRGHLIRLLVCWLVGWMIPCTARRTLLKFEVRALQIFHYYYENKSTMDTSFHRTAETESTHKGGN